MSLRDSRIRRFGAKLRIGDKVAAVATPVGRVIRSRCIDKETNELKPDSKCNKMKTKLNLE